ncbi:MAG: DUF494 family protein [Bacteroidia bacterium]|nr:DUF494 family protein [Bacteroidia bacterium]MDW8346199.1 DUF494 family protein [Bacteroidia bacterium]
MFTKLFPGIYWLLVNNLYKDLSEMDTKILQQKGFTQSEIFAILSYIAEKNSKKNNIWSSKQPRRFNQPEMQHISQEARTAIQLFQKTRILNDEEVEDLIEHLMEDASHQSSISFNHKIGLEMVFKLAYLMFIQPGSPYKKEQKTPFFTGKERIC